MNPPTSPVSRRSFLGAGLGLAGLGVLSACGISVPRWQAPIRVPRIGVLVIGSATAPQVQRYVGAFRQGLDDLGYVEGRTLAVEWRYADGQADRVPGLATELAGLGLAAVVAQGGADAVLRQAITEIPLVIATMGNPVAGGIVESLARPGGNVTGLSINSSLLGGKQLELLKEVAPGIARVAMLLPGSTSPASVNAAMQEREATARSMGLALQRVTVSDRSELEPALDAAVRAGIDALTSASSSFLTDLRVPIVEQVALHRLPAIYPQREFVEAGGLMSYGADLAELWRRAATYVDKIVKGARPADLPIEQASTFDFPLNLRAAQAIGLTLPQSVLVQATQVIQ